jgi:hypothetical protein
MRDVIESFSHDRGFFEAAGDRCFTEPRFEDVRQHSLGAMGRLLRRAQDAGAVRTDLAPRPRPLRASRGAPREAPRGSPALPASG